MAGPASAPRPFRHRDVITAGALALLELATLASRPPSPSRSPYCRARAAADLTRTGHHGP